jgi:hypothetical protein
MESLSNVIFNYKANNNYSTKQLQLNALIHRFEVDAITMIISDCASDEEIITFQVNAALVKSTDPDKLQQLKLKTKTINTYNLELYSYTNRLDGPTPVYTLCGRHTSEARNNARKLLLQGLASAEYKSSVEVARRDVLYMYSSFITSTLFDTSNIKAVEYTPVVNTWLTKLLG